MARRREDQFADLYETHRSAVWRYCCRRVGASRADDAMADVYLTVWRRIDEVPQADDALPWLYRVAHLTVSNHWRSARRRDRLAAKAASIGGAPPASPSDQVAARDEVRHVVSLLDRMSASDRELLMLVAWEQLSTDDLASVLDISPVAAKQRLSRARRRLTRLHTRSSEHQNDSPPLLGKEVRGEY